MSGCISVSRGERSVRVSHSYSIRGTGRGELAERGVRLLELLYCINTSMIEKQGSYLLRPNSMASATVIPCKTKLPLIWHADRPPFHRARPVTEMGRQLMFIACVSTPDFAWVHA